MVAVAGVAWDRCRLLVRHVKSSLLRRSREHTCFTESNAFHTSTKPSTEEQSRVWSRGSGVSGTSSRLESKIR